MTWLDYGTNIEQMLDDIADHQSHRAVYMTVRGGPEPGGSPGTFLVVTWRGAHAVWLAYEALAADQVEQIGTRQKWAMEAHLRGLVTDSRLAVAGCWPVGAGAPGYTRHPDHFVAYEPPVPVP